MGFSPNIVGPSLGRAVPLKLPEAQASSRRGIEFVRPGGFLSSWKTIVTSIRRSSQPVTTQAGEMMILSILANGTAAIGFSLEPPLTVALPSFATMILGVMIAAAGRFKKEAVDEIGIFKILKTVSGHAYQVHDPKTGLSKQLQPLDPIVEIHINDGELKRRLKEVPRKEKPARFVELLKSELPKTLKRLQEVVADSKSQAIRLWTTLHPKYFEGLESFEIKEVQLSEKTPEKASWMTRAAAKFLKFSSEGFLTTRRFLTFLKNAGTFLKSETRLPEDNKIARTFPTRTYLIFPEDLPHAIRALSMRSPPSR